MERCPYCKFWPATQRFGGYCSADCEEQSEDVEFEADRS